MSAIITPVTIRCDWCARTMPTNCTTVKGARGVAERRGWRVTHLAGGMHPDPSGAPAALDMCPTCRHATEGPPANTDGALPLTEETR